MCDKVVVTKRDEFIKVLCTVFLGFFLASVFYVDISFAQESEVCPIVDYEGNLVQLNPKAYDPDPEIGPAGRLIWEFGSPFNSTGTWQTRKGQSGIYEFWVSVSDGELSDLVHSCVDLFPNNRNPVLLPVESVTVKRGESASISATCYDPDGDAVNIIYRFNGKDVGFIRYEPPGVYDLEVMCTDGFGGVDKKHATITVIMQDIDSYTKEQPAQKPFVSIPSGQVDSGDEREVISPKPDFQSGEDRSVVIVDDIEVMREEPDAVVDIPVVTVKSVEDVEDVDVVYELPDSNCPDCLPCDEGIDVVIAGYPKVYELNPPNKESSSQRKFMIDGLAKNKKGNDFIIEQEREPALVNDCNSCESAIERKRVLDNSIFRCCK